MRTAIKAFVGFLATFLIVDIAFILLFAQDFYDGEISGLLRDKPKLFTAFLFYIIYAAIAVRLIILPSKTSGLAAQNGCLMGLVSYGTYTFTNYAMIEGWTVSVVFVDVIWGMFITALCCVIGYRTAK